MNRLITILLLISFIPVNSLATCEKPVTQLQKGEPAPCLGYLFSPEKEREMYLLNEDTKLLKEKYTLLDKSVTLYKSQVLDLEIAYEKADKKAQLWEERAIKSTEKLVESESGRGNRDLLFIGLGVILTILSAWGYGQVAGN